MKNFKNIVVIVALCAIGSATAKQMGATRLGYTGGTTPPKPLPNAQAMTPSHAETAIDRELAHIEQNLNKIKNAAAGVLQNNKVSLTEKVQFMKKHLEATYQSIGELMQEHYASLAQKLGELTKGQSQLVKEEMSEEGMSEEEMRMRRE